MARQLGLAVVPGTEAHALPQHPERPERLQAIRAHLEKNWHWKDARHLEIAPATDDDLRRVHLQSHIDLIQSSAGRTGAFDGDTYFCPESARLARLAAGAALETGRAVLRGDVDTAMALVRPPGHHAERAQPMGFCLFNNVAVAAAGLRAEFALERLAIVDFDVHHGNGTQDIFYRDAGVFFLSSHQFPFYPGTGAADERGEGPGLGTTLNVPVPMHTDGKALRAALAPALEKLQAFRPEFLLFSAGFDAHAHDPLGMLHLETEDFYSITKDVLGAAAAVGCTRVASVLEGGYDLRALAESLEAHLNALVDGP